MLTCLTEMTDAYVQAEFQLGNVEDGLLPSAFLAGLLIASIVYSELTTRYNAFRLTGKQGPLRRLGFCHAIIAMHECLQSTLASACKGLHSQGNLANNLYLTAEQEYCSASCISASALYISACIQLIHAKTFFIFSSRWASWQ